MKGARTHTQSEMKAGGESKTEKKRKTQMTSNWHTLKKTENQARVNTHTHTPQIFPPLCHTSQFVDNESLALVDNLDVGQVSLSLSVHGLIGQAVVFNALKKVFNCLILVLIDVIWTAHFHLLWWEAQKVKSVK